VAIRAGSELAFTCTLDAIRLWCVIGIRSLTPTFSTVMIFVVLRLITRRQATAIALGTIAIFGWWSALAAAPVLWLELVAEALVVALFTCVMIRFGLLAALVAYFTFSLYPIVPLTLDVTHWSASSSNQTIALIAGLALFGFYASRAGQPLFGRLET
jgi:hypothetical protein